MRRVGIVLFFVVLCLPAVQSLTGWIPDTRIEENRVLNAWPTTSLAADPVSYVAQAEAWFDDRFGLRPFLIRLKTQIDFSVFNTSTRVHVGKDGWLFYRSVLDTEKPAMERYLAANGDAVAAGIEGLGSALKARNVRLVVMPILLGDVFYRNMLPPSVPDLPHPSRFGLAMERWRKLPDIIYIDTTGVMRKVMRSREAFQRTDFHWNGPAAFEVARVLVNTIATREAMPGSVFDHRLKIARLHFIGKESEFLPLFHQPSEETLSLVQTWSDASVVKEPGRGVFEQVTTQTDTDARTLPSLCVVGDSFYDGIEDAGVDMFFHRTYRIRWTAPDDLGTMLRHLPGDCRYLLVEFIEVQYRAVDEFALGAYRLLHGAPNASKTTGRAL
jgi:hypothetical protein